MAKISKKRKAILGKVDAKKTYQLSEAAALVKEVTTTKSDALQPVERFVTTTVQFVLVVAVVIGLETKALDKSVLGDHV